MVYRYEGDSHPYLLATRVQYNCHTTSSHLNKILITGPVKYGVWQIPPLSVTRTHVLCVSCLLSDPFPYRLANWSWLRSPFNSTGVVCSNVCLHWRDNGVEKSSLWAKNSVVFFPLSTQCNALYLYIWLVSACTCALMSLFIGQVNRVRRCTGALSDQVSTGSRCKHCWRRLIYNR